MGQQVEISKIGNLVRLERQRRGLTQQTLADMFLKPEVTKDYAARVGHPLASVYEARLDFAVYSSLLDLASRTSDELSDLRPRDRIDIQSFIWVVGAYREEQEDV